MSLKQKYDANIQHSNFSISASLKINVYFVLWVKAWKNWNDRSFLRSKNQINFQRYLWPSKTVLISVWERKLFSLYDTMQKNCFVFFIAFTKVSEKKWARVMNDHINLKAVDNENDVRDFFSRQSIPQRLLHANIWSSKTNPHLSKASVKHSNVLTFLSSGSSFKHQQNTWIFFASNFFIIFIFGIHKSFASLSTRGKKSLSWIMWHGVVQETLFFPFHFRPYSDHVLEVFLLHYAANKRYMSLVNMIWEFNTQTDKKSISKVLFFFKLFTCCCVKVLRLGRREKFSTLTFVMRKKFRDKNLTKFSSHKARFSFVCFFHNKSISCIEFPLSFHHLKIA